MYRIPQRPPEPPEPAAVAVCPACGEYLFPGDPVWLDRREARQICMDHLDSDAARLFGCGMSAAHEL